MSTRRAWALPSLVVPPRRILVPLKRSEWHQAQVGHELAGVGEAGEVADIGDHGRRRDNQADPAHRLHALDHRRHRPGRQELLDLALQTREPCFRVLDRVDVVLEHDLLGGWSKRTVVSQRR
jgi:hypothetical protein